MKTFTQFLTALAVLAIARYVTIALGIVLLIVTIMAATVHPKQAFATAVLIGIVALAIKQPIACAVTLGTVGTAVAVTGRLRRSKPQVVSYLLLPREGTQSDSTQF